MSDQLAKGWTGIRLEELVTSRKGKKPAVTKGEPTKGFVPYLDIESIEKCTDRKYAEVASSRLATEKDVLIVWDGARSGWAGQGRVGAIGSTLMALKPLACDRDYLYRFLQSQFDQVNTNTRGTGIPHVDPGVIWNIEVPVAPFNEQLRIVAKLEKLLGKVNTCQQRLAKIPIILKRFRQSVLAAACSGRLTADWRKKHPVAEPAFLRLNKLKMARLSLLKQRSEVQSIEKEYTEMPIIQNEFPETWLLLKAKLVCDNITKGTTPKTSELRAQGDIPYLKVHHIVDNKLQFELKPVFVSRHVHETFLQRSKVYPGDVLMNIVGPPLNKVAIVPKDYPEWNINQALAIFRPVDGLHPEYLLTILAHEDTLADVLRDTKGIVGQSNISLEQCRDLAIPIPPVPEQQEIVRRVEAFFKLADQVEARFKMAKARVDQLTQSLLAKAFRGELVSQNPNDEPASALLERIKAERTKGETEGKGGGKKRLKVNRKGKGL